MCSGAQLAPVPLGMRPRLVGGLDHPDAQPGEPEVQPGARDVMGAVALGDHRVRATDQSFGHLVVARIQLAAAVSSSARANTVSSPALRPGGRAAATSPLGQPAGLDRTGHRPMPPATNNWSVESEVSVRSSGTGMMAPQCRRAGVQVVVAQRRRAQHTGQRRQMRLFGGRSSNRRVQSSSCRAASSVAAASCSPCAAARPTLQEPGPQPVTRRHVVGPGSGRGVRVRGEASGRCAARTLRCRRRRCG